MRLGSIDRGPVGADNAIADTGLAFRTALVDVPRLT